MWVRRFFGASSFLAYEMRVSKHTVRSDHKGPRTMQTDHSTPKRISADETRSIRHKVLRPNQLVSACVYLGDDEPLTGHYGVYDGETLIGIASVFEEVVAHAPELKGWRIRGMAVLPELQRQGYGTRLLEACVHHAQDASGEIVWCNARTTAARFYGRHGFTIYGASFDLPGIGPHYMMIKSIDR